VPIEKLTPDSLASAITATLADPAVRKRASEVQSLLAPDNGVHAAVDLISRFMQRPWDRTAMQVYL
jgi:UDP:flavonoid glycosyltransferase YjiC (YdhE family)